ncbi:hypothetical protein HUA74_40295 [Myxococcus sp. CA051A]|uniref:hypothetical protein n=1 Tax=unclassified Myxococcus TaxID=2648731 RepID=UPI00157AC5E6|nr:MULTISPECIES: hypothetical protein [unclassified Myxococcus]NTX41581.1 hypothetical protein [Myxococcus sp. CA033]NTX66909.1 hypothetical protein [Myxococcus sp. CA051A]
MSVPTIVKHFLRGAVIVSAGVLLGACGEPLASEEEGIDTGDTVTALDIPPPTATMGCGRNPQTYAVSCTGSASNGVAPYTYQWSIIDDFGNGPYGDDWWNNSTTYSDYCQWGLYTYGTYYDKYIRFRVLDANTYVSNVVQVKYRCWSPN